MTSSDTNVKKKSGTHVEKMQIDEGNSKVQKLFLGYREELDKRHDKHERLVKISRDITVDSKRTIFLLQRHAGNETNSEILQQAMEKLQEIQKEKFQKIAVELEGEDPYQFLRAYSAGLQEYIEALSFYHYLKSKCLVSLDVVQKDLYFPKQCDTSQTDESCDHLCVHVPHTEYVLGLADLTGELMRLAINSVGAGNLDVPFQVCEFLREIRTAYSSLQYVSREMSRKVMTLQQSLQKVETACYTLQVRGSEIPKHMLVDVFKSGPSQGFMFDDDSIHVDD